MAGDRIMEEHDLNIDLNIAITASGYLSRTYADAVRGTGQIIELPRSGGWLIRNDIPGTPYFDAAGPYPLFSCSDWNELPADLKNLSGTLVSIRIVTDPFGGFDEDILLDGFPHIMRRYKMHQVIDLEQEPPRLPENHRRNLRFARDRVEIKKSIYPVELSEEWIRLYGILRHRHNISGAADFERWSLKRQLRVPGLHAWSAIYENEIAGIALWMTHNKYAYYHLAAYNTNGYSCKVSFALFDEAIGFFREQGFKAIDLGAAPGLAEDRNSGLLRFKKGWANRELPVYLCGRICDQIKYETLKAINHVSGNHFFPAYRDRPLKQIA